MKIIHTSDWHLGHTLYDHDRTEEQLDMLGQMSGLASDIQPDLFLLCGDIKDFIAPKERCLTITNPPYGERLLDVKAAEELYKIMGERFIREDGQKYYIISPHDEFEKFFGANADKRRKLYNGMIKCQLFMYFKKP